MSIPTEPHAEPRTPLYWLRQRRGDVETIRLNEAEAEAIAQRAGGHGDFMKPSGFVWREKDDDECGGYAYFTITPVYAPEPS